MRPYFVLSMCLACGGGPSSTETPPPRSLPETHVAPVVAPAQRVDPAQVELAKALEGTSDDVKLAAERVAQMARAGEKIDPVVVDALWKCFMKLKPSASKSLREVVGVHDAILAVKDASYASKAMTLLATPIDPADPNAQRDELAFRQTTAVQLIDALAYTPAARTLVTVLMTRAKMDLGTLVLSALLRMPREAVPLLTSALTKSDAQFATLAHDWDDQGFVPFILTALAYTSLDSARAAIVAALPNLGDAHRGVVAMLLPWFPTTPDLVATFERTCEKLPSVGMERSNALGVAGELFDSSIVKWVIAEGARGTGDFAVATRLNAVQSAVKVMRREDKARVATAVNALDSAVVGEMRSRFAQATQALDKCAIDAACYVGILDEPISQAVEWKAVKAAYMAGVLGGVETRRDLIARLPKITSTTVRVAILLAVNHLAPSGDRTGADALDKIVSDDPTRIEPFKRVSAMLRARAN